MALISMRAILDHAAAHDYGLPAFNVTNMETLLSVMRAAARTDSPVIVQFSQSARKYMEDAMVASMIQGAAARFPDVPLCVHQDHGSSPAICKSAMDLGFTSVMMDGSLLEDGRTASDFAYNAGVTAEVVAMARPRGVSVEGEIGVLGSLESGGGEQEDGHGIVGTLSRDALLTDPQQAADFVAATGVDALAVAIGTSHGAYKFSRKPTGDLLAMDVIAAIHARLPHTHLVMHGASSVPPELQDLINENGGAIPRTWGVPLEDVESAIRLGVRKVNIDTDLRMALTGSVRKYLQDNPASFDIRALLKGAQLRMEELCAERLERFGAAGQGSKLAR